MLLLDQVRPVPRARGRCGPHHLQQRVGLQQRTAAARDRDACGHVGNERPVHGADRTRRQGAGADLCAVGQRDPGHRRLRVHGELVGVRRHESGRRDGERRAEDAAAANLELRGGDDERHASRRVGRHRRASGREGPVLKRAQRVAGVGRLLGLAGADEFFDFPA